MNNPPDDFKTALSLCLKARAQKDYSKALFWLERALKLLEGERDAPNLVDVYRRQGRL